MLGRKWQAVPLLIRFMITNVMDGAVIGCVFGLILIRLDINGLGRLLEGYETAGPTALFLGQGALIFGALGFAVAVLNHGAEDE